MDYYFSYGSNLDMKRMNDRGITVYDVIPAKLENYELKFNKVSKNQGAVANVMLKAGSVVEGALYQVDDIKILDKYEGCPKHYNRIQMTFGHILAWVYVAQPQHIQEGLKPQQEYLNHLLEGKSYMSTEYYEKLKRINE